MIQRLLAATLLMLAVCNLDLHSQSPVSSGGRVIAGVVVSAASGQPLASADVTLQETAGFRLVAEAQADTDGRFSFSNLTDGKFILSAAHRGYVSSAYQEHDGPLTAIITGEGQQTTGLTLSLAPLGAIFGRVVEDSGDPVPDAHLQLYWRARFNGSESVRRGAVATADSMGNFEFPQVAPGEYYLCASGVPWYRSIREAAPQGTSPLPSSLDVAYPQTCYPNSPDSAGAEPIPITAGDRIQSDVTMHALPSMHIFVDLPRGDPRTGISMPQLQRDAFGILDPVVAQAAVLPENGQGDPGSVRIELTGIPTGQYSLELQDPGQSHGTARMSDIDLASSDLHVDAASLPTLASVSGTLAITGGARSPADCSIYLNSEEGNSGGYAKVAADGTFRIPAVPPGLYEVSILAGTANLPLPVTRLSAAGSTISDSLLRVDNAPIRLSVDAANPVAAVAGVVNRNGKPAGGVFALLVPQRLNASRYIWQPNQSDSDGSVTFDQVAPGTYTVVAIDQGWTLDWRKPEVISPYLAGGVRVTVGQNAKKVELSSPIETQSIGADSK